MRGNAALAAAFGFLAFLPYPAISVGQRTGMQMGNILAVMVAAMTLTVSWRRKPFYVLPLLLLPPCLSLIKVALVDSGDLSLAFKPLISVAVAGQALIATQFLAPRHAMSLMKGIACATILHAAVGVWQLIGFSQGELPLLFLYINPSFLSVQENAATIAQYIQRPFGLFPEPSAMSASLAPWALFWVAEMLGIVQLRHSTTYFQRVLFGTAALAALGLIILSRSGHAAITMAAAALFALIWLARSRASIRSYSAFFAVFGVLLPLFTLLLIYSLSQRIDGTTGVDQSWRDRASSLSGGLTLYASGGPATLIFGLGPGLLAPRMVSSTGLDATWSISLSFIYQTGIIGLLIVLWLLHYLLRVWHRAGRSAAFAGICLVWIVGITVTTSYGQLLPLWMTLGWLTVWPSVCAPTRPARLTKPRHELEIRRRRIAAQLHATPPVWRRELSPMRPRAGALLEPLATEVLGEPKAGGSHARDRRS